MSRNIRITHFLAIVGIALSLSSCSDSNKSQPVTTDSTSSNSTAADYVLTNGKIYTVNPEQEWAQAVAISGNTIVYVGDNNGASAYVGGATEAVDLQQHLVLPGFVESHIHLAGGAGTSSGLILSTADSIEEILQKIKDYAEANPDKATIFGASYLSSLFGPEGPTKELLDAVVSDRPVFLMDNTAHAVWVNSKAYEVAGITINTPDVEGGEYVKNAKGELSGQIRGNPAFIPVLEATKAITPESLMAVMPSVLEGLSGFGFTTAMDMGMPFATEEAYQAFVSLDEKGEFPLRLSVAYYVNTPARAANGVEKLDEYARWVKSEHVWMDTLKILGDGVLENERAALLEPYLTTGDRGLLSFDLEELKGLMLPAAKKGYNITIHAIGDRTTRTFLDAAQAVREAGYKDTILSTTHSQMIQPDDRPRYKELDITMQTTGNWMVSWDSYIELLGKERYETLLYPVRTIADDGVNIAFGADWPATTGGFENGVHPFNNIYSVMHRKGPIAVQAELGTVDKVLLPANEVLTLAEAVAAYTIGGARMLGIEDQIGTIEVGKKADMIFLDQNLFEIDPLDIPKTKVLVTMFDGKLVHDVHDVLYDPGDKETVDLDDLNVSIEKPML